MGNLTRKRLLVLLALSVVVSVCLELREAWKNVKAADEKTRLVASALELQIAVARAEWRREDLQEAILRANWRREDPEEAILRTEAEELKLEKALARAETEELRLEKALARAEAEELKLEKALARAEAVALKVDNTLALDLVWARERTMWSAKRKTVVTVHNKYISDINQAWSSARRRAWTERADLAYLSAQEWGKVGLLTLVIFLSLAITARMQARVLIHPDGKHQRFAAAFFSQKTNKHVLEPVLRDLRDEYMEALAEGRLWKARWVRIRGTWSFWAAVVTQFPTSLLKWLKAFVT